MQIINDKFYTKRSIAEECIKAVDLTLYDYIIEPSAGNGSFSSQIPNCVAYDIEPESEGIIKQDYLQLAIPNCKNLLVIGNPPFGKRSTLAKEFIKKSISLGANTIAFILPDTFSKLTMQKVFPKEWKLIKVHKITDTSFEIGLMEYHVPCSFYVWSNFLPGKDLREKEVPASSDFTFLKRGDLSADFTLNGNSGKVKDLWEVTNSKAEHYIKGSQEVRDLLSNIKWDFKSSVNGGVSWLSQQDILKKYYDYKEGE